MASVTNIYARAFADVIVERPTGCESGVEGIARDGRAARFKHDLRKVLETPSIPAERSGKCWMRSWRERDFRSLCEIFWPC